MSFMLLLLKGMLDYVIFLEINVRSSLVELSLPSAQ
jgi:hypothetical protein